ncbi:hypothetical protein BDQ12DRAFT_673543 [Crucibulum laeve]|uniref:Uncharacterized protein n=1 Tax=Crucibulum laeve TaxID=68775 RepID=A0A5C3MH81_9AGAR|nr:hypothetical protein BDQ12DRAFT_673543 [Crucibulum laeve]
MAKTSKKGPAKAGQPITDFFPRKASASQVSSTPVPSVAQKPATQDALSSSSLKHGLEACPKLSNSNSMNARANGLKSPLKTDSRLRLIMPTIAASAPKVSAKGSIGSGELNPPPISSRKRSRSPDVQKPKRVAIAKASGNRMSKFDSDSESDAPESVVYVKPRSRPIGALGTPLRVSPLSPRENLTSTPSQGNSGARKRTKLSSPAFHNGYPIPSSQSDEEEIAAPCLASHPAEDVKQTIISPSTEALPSASQTDISGHVDLKETSSLLMAAALSPPADKTIYIPARRTATISAFLTPPPTEYPDRPSLPATPVSLDEATKTQQMIKMIKEKALAAAKSSPEQILLDLERFDTALADSSDDDDSPFNFLKNKSNSVSTSTSSSKVTTSISSGRSSRYSPRSQSSLSPLTSEHNSTSPSLFSTKRTRVVPAKGPVILTKTTIATKSSAAMKKHKASDPIATLLEEKKAADQRGRGDDAFTLAESTASELHGKHSLFAEMEEEYDEDADFWSATSTSQLISKGRERMANKTAIAEDDILLEDEDRKKLFGEEGGKGIASILQSDREKRAQDKAREKIAGVKLWKDDSNAEAMVVDTTYPVLNYTGGHKILQLLKGAVDRSDYFQAALLLDTGILALSKAAQENNHLISYLCNLALNVEVCVLALPAFRAVLQIWAQESEDVPGISFSDVKSTLVRLGADPSILRGMGWPVETTPSTLLVDAQEREDLLYRLVVLISSSSKRLSAQEIPDIVTALLLIAIEPASSEELRRDVSGAVHAICTSTAPDEALCPGVEVAICNKVLTCIVGYKPINKAHILSFLAEGSGRTRRIARWVAHAIIAEKAEVTVEAYGDLPLLVDLIDQLTRVTPSDSEQEPGKLELHNKTDYVDLGLYVYILSIALTNIKGYVEEEVRTSKAKAAALRPPDSPTKSAYEKPETELQVVRAVLESLHSRITDTRAAHLDRSRTKAAVKSVSMRLHYQRQALLRNASGGMGKPKPNILKYFSSKN